MATLTFDTLKFVETVEEGGLNREQAAAIAKAIHDSRTAEDLVTKRDLTELENKITNQIRELELRMIIKLGLLIIIAVGALGTFLKLT